MKIDNPKAFQNPELNRSVGCAKLDSSSLQCSEGRNEVNLFIIKTHILTFFVHPASWWCVWLLWEPLGFRVKKWYFQKEQGSNPECRVTE